MNARLMLPVAVLVGLLLPVQFALNSALTTYTGGPVATAAISYAVGTLAIAVGLLVGHRGRVPLRALVGAPAWSYLGGVIGSAYVVGSVVLTRELGAALAVTLVIAAQVTASLLIDHFGLLGMKRRPITRTRAVVLALVLAALALQVL
ncbi:DMT family transporter [Deinococcus pimensis]|uniref:DMT family transporter n=1 Tax=Deinococcus pimensis TaxID=309888 RepID=UPI0004859428|nr:DMT family transporter [Deinococcus pimensis]